MADASIDAEDDGLFCSDVGAWAETKYRLLDLYFRLFATGMKKKWDQRVYIDLYSGAGCGRVKGTTHVLKGSPMIALSVPDPFDKYIFCEEDPPLMEALRERVRRVAPSSEVSFIEGSCDDNVDRILSEIPRASSQNSVLSLCMVDPYDFGLKFETIRGLSKVFIDFVVLLATGMDANRNQDFYVQKNSSKIDEALGNTAWLDRWKEASRRSEFGEPRAEFTRFLADEFAAGMERLAYLNTPIDRMRLVRNTEKNARYTTLRCFRVIGLLTHFGTMC